MPGQTRPFWNESVPEFSCGPRAKPNSDRPDCCNATLRRAESTSTRAKKSARFQEAGDGVIDYVRMGNGTHVAQSFELNKLQSRKRPCQQRGNAER
jgi:hypothetical protein